MLALCTLAGVAFVAAWLAMRRAEPFDRKACRPALWMTLPGVLVPAILVGITVVILHAYEDPRHYERVPSDLRWIRKAWWPLFWLTPMAFVVALLSFAAYPAGQPAKYIPRGPGTARSRMFWLRVVVLVSTVVVFCGTLVAALRGSVF